MGREPLLEVRGLKKWYPQRRNLFGTPAYHVRALNGVSFSVGENETLSIVGESGCGKTTLCRAMIGLIPPDAGQVLYRGADLTRLSGRRRQEMMRDFQMVFQDPYSSLDPRMTVGDIISEPMDIRREPDRVSRIRRLAELMQQCGLDPSYMRRYPHEFSGGQRQRISIARALSSAPRILICDEPVSALDVSIQSQILNLLRRIQREHRLSLVFVSHDLKVVHHVSDRVTVMYLGHIMEIGSRREVFSDPRHPYTRRLLSSIPGRVSFARTAAPDDAVPGAAEHPSGCVFHPRCPMRGERCDVEVPQLRSMGGGHAAACHYA